MLEMAIQVRKKINILVKEFLAGVSVLAFSTWLDFKNTTGWEALGIMTNLWSYLAIITSIVVLLYALALIALRIYKPSKIAFMILLFYSYIALVTIINGYSIVKRGFLGNIFFILLFDIILMTEDQSLFNGVLKTLNILTLLNFVSIILAPENGYSTYNPDLMKWWSGYYLLGYDNGHIVMLLPTICFNLLIYFRKKKKKNLFFSFIAIISIFWFFSATSMVAIVIATAIFILCEKRDTIKAIISNKVIITVSVVSVYAVYLLTNEFRFFSNLFMRLFNKDTTSVGRGRVVSIGLSYIKEKWLTGYGYVVDKYWIGGYNSPHNLMLDIMLAGGIIGLVIFFLILWKTTSQCHKYVLKDKGCMLFLSAILGVLLASITEGYDTYCSFCFLWSLFLSLGNWQQYDNLLSKL